MKKESIADTPSIPSHIYEHMPTVLKDLASSLTSKREKDLLITGALTTIGGVFSQVKGNYNVGFQHTPLYTFIVAPPASNKGTLKLPEALVNPIHEYLMNKSKANQKSNNSKSGTDNLEDGIFEEKQTVKPTLRTLFIPGNSSSAAIISHLNKNDGKGILFETEADTVSNAIKQDWGNFSDLLRKGFHGERISASRKLKDEFIEVTKPRLAVLLSGTPNQVPTLIQSSEDGLFSRFIFYVYSTPIKWKDVTPTQERNEVNFKVFSWGQKLLEIYKHLDECEIIVSLSSSQWKLFNDTFSMISEDIVADGGEDFISSVYRMGVITHRIVMTLSFLRFIEDQKPSKFKPKQLKIECSDTDLMLAIELSKVYLQHSILMYNSLPNSSDTKINKGYVSAYNKLPAGTEMTRAEIDELLMEQLKVSKRTVTNYVKKMLQHGLITQDRANGPYQIIQLKP